MTDTELQKMAEVISQYDNNAQREPAALDEMAEVFTQHDNNAQRMQDALEKAMSSKNVAVFTVNSHHAYLNSDIIISCNGHISLEDTSTGNKYDVIDEQIIHLTAGHHILKTKDHEEEIIIEDAIKLGGGRIKNAFVFDGNPYIFVTTKDRLYISNIETGDEKVEYNITPDSIVSLGKYNGKPCEYFLFQTNKDYSIYNVNTGKVVFTFLNHIYTNNHLVIYKSEQTVIVYDYRLEKVIIEFEGQYSFDSKLFFVKEGKLYALNLSSSYINTIDFVGKVENNYVLYNNNLVKLVSDYLEQKTYKFFSLGNGEKYMEETSFTFPYYIESWSGHSFGILESLKSELDQFRVKHKTTKDYPNIKCTIFEIKIISLNYYWEKEKRYVKLSGEIVTHPSIRVNIPFTLGGEVGNTANFCNCVVEHNNALIEQKKESELQITPYSIPKEETILGKSESGMLVISQLKGNLFYWDTEKDTKQMILKRVFDSSHYTNAFFTSDGKNVIFVCADKTMHIMGFEDLSTESFDIEGMTVPRLAGFNGYKPEIEILDCRKPVWRDPISLVKIQSQEFSDHIFMSPDGIYSADNDFKMIVKDRICDKDITLSEYNRLCKEYDFLWNDSEGEKERKIAHRKELLTKYGKDILFKYIVERYSYLINTSDRIPENEKSERIEWAVNSEVEEYINKKETFTSLFLDKLGYVMYRNNSTNEEKKILIGRSVYFLNYVSFSYDSRYLAFAAKMKRDDFRFSEDGVFVLYDLKEDKEIIRQDHGQDLYAVWMTMFSKDGNVAYYDSRANAYIATKDSGYKKIEEIEGKSLLCFSPSGKYIAFSDQNYIDYTHHPNANWGHQPSGNIFIHSMNDVKTCLEHFNDFGDGIVGVVSRAGSVASAAFSCDERRLMAVGDDGVVVIRNLHIEDDEYICDYPPTAGSDERHDYRKDERNGIVFISYYGTDGGIDTDVFDYWCEPDETLDSEQGLIYSADGRRLIRSLSITNEEYTIKEGVKRIENGVFHGIYGPGSGADNSLCRLHIPDSIEYIGDDAFDDNGIGVTIFVNPNKINVFRVKFPSYQHLFAPELLP